MEESEKQNRLAAFLILQLCEQGRWEETIAQMIASVFIDSGDENVQNLATSLGFIFSRISELYDVQGQIWPGLLAGTIGINTNEPVWEIVETDRTLPRPAQDRDVWSISLWYDGTQRGSGSTTAESVLNLAEEMKTRFDNMSRLHPRLSARSAWAAWLTENDSEQHYLMTYEDAQLIIAMDLANSAWKSRFNQDEFVVVDNDFQTIADEMARQGDIWAKMHERD